MKKRLAKDSDQPESGIIIGILGHPWRATVDQGGNVRPWDGSPSLQWFIAAEDRWHLPAEEVATRQSTIEGTPVVETRVRVPQGDVIQRVWVASGREMGPAVVVEFENDSARAVAIALSREDVFAPRAARDVNSESGEKLSLPSDEIALTLPLGHRTRVRIALPCDRTSLDNRRVGVSETMEYDEYLGRLTDWPDVVRGWIALCERASRFVVPDVVNAVKVTDGVTAERCRVALDPPQEFADAISAERCLIAWRDLVRMGLDAPELESVVSAVEFVARDIKRRHEVTADIAQAVMSAAYLLHNIDPDTKTSAPGTHEDLQRDLQGDLHRVIERAVGRKERSLWQLVSPTVAEPSRLVEQLESGLVQWSDAGEVTLCPSGIPEHRLGVNIEAHGVAVGAEHRVSFALRWHGARPAVIWEVVGPPGLRLRSGVDANWSTTDPTGEGLWHMPAEPVGPSVSFS